MGPQSRWSSRTKAPFVVVNSMCDRRGACLAHSMLFGSSRIGLGVGALLGVPAISSPKATNCRRDAENAENQLLVLRGICVSAAKQLPFVVSANRRERRP